MWFSTIKVVYEKNSLNLSILILCEEILFLVFFFHFRLNNIPLLINTLDRLEYTISHDKDIFGVEYLAFVHDRFQNQFECLICAKQRKGSMKNMMLHFKSKTHHLAYLEKHFPTAHESLRRLKENMNLSLGMYVKSCCLSKEKIVNFCNKFLK